VILNDSLNINEAKTADLGNGNKAYQYNGKYYLKASSGQKKEISADQYHKLLSKSSDNKLSSKGTESSTKSSDDKTFDYGEDFSKLEKSLKPDYRGFRSDEDKRKYNMAKEISKLQKAGISPDEAESKYKSQLDKAEAKISKISKIPYNSRSPHDNDSYQKAVDQSRKANDVLKAIDDYYDYVKSKE